MSEGQRGARRHQRWLMFFAVGIFAAGLWNGKTNVIDASFLAYVVFCAATAVIDAMRALTKDSA